MKVVASGIDTLVIGYSIQRWKGEDAFKRFAYEKEQAGNKLFSDKKGRTVELAGREFSLSPKGTRGYEYVLSNADLTMCLAADAVGANVMPECMVTFRSVYLWARGYQKAVSEFREWLDTWAIVTGDKVSRVDLCCDVVMECPRLDFQSEVVTRASHKEDYFEVAHYTRGRRDTGYKLGRGSLVGRIYDKALEVKGSGKSWFHEIWLREGWQAGDPVTRIEFQCRREFLHEMTFSGFDELLLGMPDIWRYCTDKWLRVCTSGKDSHKHRWQASEWWQVVQAVRDHFGQCLGMQRYKACSVKFRQLIDQLRGVMLSALAVDIPIRGEYFAIMQMRDRIIRWLDEDEKFKAELAARRGKYATMSRYSPA